MAKKKITRSLFERYRKRFSPYCSVASLYFRAVAGGAMGNLKDPAPVKKKETENEKGIKNKSDKKSG